MQTVAKARGGRCLSAALLGLACLTGATVAGLAARNLVRSDPPWLETNGTPPLVVENAAQSASGVVQYISGVGIIAPGGIQAPQISGRIQAAQDRRLAWVDRNGREQLLAAPAHTYSRPRLSPDGRRVAMTILEHEEQVWIYDLALGTLTRLTFEEGVNLDAVWTPDGRRVTFESSPPGGVLWQLADGSGKAERLVTSRRYPQVPTSWSPDGKVLAFVEVNATTGQDIWVLRLRDRRAQPFLRTPFHEGAPAFSPDGRWLAYGSDESGRPEIYVQPYPGPGGKWQISAEGGTEPAWNRNGRELFYRNGNRMMLVDVIASPSFSADRPRMLFEDTYALSTSPSTRNYDVSPDGQRFLMVKDAESPK